MGLTFLSHAIVAACASLVACGSSTTPPLAEVVVDPPCAEPGPDAAGFRRIDSQLIASRGTPRHGAVDALATPGSSATVEGKFQYGSTLKDLEGEDVVGYLAPAPPADDTCPAWTEIGSGRTNGDGRIAFDVPAHLLSDTGRYLYQLIAVGDLSSAHGVIWVFPAGMRAALFDIDGTLTTDDFQLAADFLTPEGARAYDGAVEVVEYHREQGRQPLYLTGRPYFLDDTTRTWLEAQGFPAGPLTLAPAVDVALDGVQAYKHDVLVDWQERVQTNIEVAYGNASTDVCAYAAAGLAPGHTYIIGPNAGTACPGFEPTQPVTSYPEHLDALGE